MLIGKTGVRITVGTAEDAGRGYPAYAPLVLGGLALCVVVAVALALVRKRGRDDVGPEDAVAPAPPSGSETRPAGTAPAGTTRDPVRPRRVVGDQDGTGAGTSGPQAVAPGREGTEGVGGVEERVRARVGEDPRTKDLPPVSVEVDDGMAWINGSVPSPEARQALTEVVGGVEGVDIVVNRVMVSRP